MVAIVAYMQRLGRDIKVTTTADNGAATRRAAGSATNGGTN